MTTLGSNCESCSTPHDGTYGSGRFCSSRCARGFSTKTKRAEINEKVRKTLSGRSTGRTINPELREKMTAGMKKFLLRNLVKNTESTPDTPWWACIPFEELKSDGPRKKRILLDQNDKCNHCGISEWNGKPITLELEHRDGNPKNPARENLECICPNCHSQTPTWRGRNVGGGDAARRRAKITDDQFVETLRSSTSFYECLGKLGLPQKGKSYSRAKRLAEQHGIILPRPEGHHSASAKLTQEQVWEVRRLRNERWTQTAIGKQFGVHREVIGQIVRGETYKNS